MSSPIDIEVFRAAVESLETRDDVDAFLDEIEMKWGLKYDETNPSVYEDADYGALVVGHVSKAMGLSEKMESMSETELYDATKLQRSQIFLFYHHIKTKTDLFDPQTATRLGNLVSMYCFAEKLIHCVHRVKRIGIDGGNKILVDPKNFKQLANMPIPISMDMEEGDGNTQFQSLLLYLLDKAQEFGYYKYQGDVYRQILTPEGRKTYAWEMVYPIKDFVYAVTDKETNEDQWKNLTHGKGNATSASEYLASCRDIQFPELVKDRSVFAFKNGLYFAKLDKFWEYSSPTPPPAGVVAAAKYFDKDCSTFDDVQDWYDIPTPNLQKILDYQEFPEDVCRWMYIFLGRLLYSVGELDGWQVIPFCKGQASSGKSTILLKVAKNFYDKEDVGILSNNIEKKFGISAFYEKYLFVAPEIKGDLQLEQAEFQSIVSGEDMQVAIKHSTARSVMWKTPGILAGNEVPGWTDNSGSITRRVVIWEFINSVENGEMDLGTKLSNEMAAILVKCNKAYLEAINMVGQDNIWQHLPSYFAQQRMQLLACTNVLVNFLKSDSVVLGADKYIPEDLFKQALTNYCLQNNLQKPKYTKEFMYYPFRQFRLQEEFQTERMYNGSLYTKKWILGVDVRDSGNNGSSIVI
jgi:hypothetical protein